MNPKEMSIDDKIKQIESMFTTIRTLYGKEKSVQTTAKREYEALLARLVRQ